jgi:hypothetical protein
VVAGQSLDYRTLAAKMSVSQTARSVADRFAAEQGYIARYVEFLRAAADIWERDVAEVTRALKRHGFELSAGRRDRARYGDPYSPEELAAVAAEMKLLKPRVEQALAAAESLVARFAEPTGLDQVDARSDVGEWIEAVTGWLEEGESPESLELARERILAQEREVSLELIEEFQPLTPAQIDFIIDSAVYIRRQRISNELHFVNVRIEELDLSARILRKDSELNILRQAFILLLTALDAAVFGFRHRAHRAEEELLPVDRLLREAGEGFAAGDGELWRV